MVTTNSKPTIDTQKQQRKELKHTTKENHQTRGKNRKKKKWTKNYKTTGKQGIKWQEVHTYQ